MEVDPVNEEGGVLTPQIDNPEEDIWKSSKSARAIKDLIDVDQNLNSVLTIAARSLQALYPDLLPSEDEKKDDQPEFEQYMEQYFETLHSVQTSLRNSIHQLRKSRISPRPLLQPGWQASSGRVNSSLSSTSNGTKPTNSFEATGAAPITIDAETQQGPNQENEEDVMEDLDAEDETENNLGIAGVWMRAKIWEDLREGLEGIQAEVGKADVGR